MRSIQTLRVLWRSGGSLTKCGWGWIFRFKRRLVVFCLNTWCFQKCGRWFVGNMCILQCITGYIHIIDIKYPHIDIQIYPEWRWKMFVCFHHIFSRGAIKVLKYICFPKGWTCGGFDGLCCQNRRRDGGFLATSRGEGRGVEFLDGWRTDAMVGDDWVLLH